MKLGCCPMCGVKITRKTANGVDLINKSKFRQIKIIYDVSKDQGSDADGNPRYHELQGPICSDCLSGVTMAAYEEALKNDPPVAAMITEFPNRELFKISCMQMK